MADESRPLSWRSRVEHKFKLVGGKEWTGHDSVWNLRPKIPTSDSSVLAASEKWWAVPYEGGGGPIFISEIDATGRIEPRNTTTVNGHKAEVYSLNFSGLDPNVLASGGDDGVVAIWKFGQETPLDILEPLTKMQEPTGIREVLFHPSVADTILSASVDGRLSLWDIQKEERATSWDFGLGINCLDVSYDGRLVLSSCRDRCARITDLRRLESVQSLERPHGTSARTFRSKFIHNRGQDLILSTGPSVSTTGRELALFDLRKPEEAVFRHLVDGQNGALMPFYYEDTGVIWLFGRGDTTIRQFEINATAKTSDEAFFPGLDFRVSMGTPHTGAAQLPGRALDVKQLEIARFKRLTASTVETISFTIPRSKDLKAFFNDDVFDTTRAAIPALDSLDAFLLPSTKNDAATIDPASDFPDASPRLISLRPEGMPLLSQRPVEVKQLNTVKINHQRKIEQEQQDHDHAQFAKLASLANQYERYQPNNSMGARPGVDSVTIEGNEVDDDEWDD